MQEAAYRRGVMRSATVIVIAMLTAALMFALTFFGIFQARRAGDLAHGLRWESESLRQRLYVADMNLAQQTWSAGGIPAVLPLVAAQQPKTGKTDLRDFGVAASLAVLPLRAGPLTMLAATNAIESCAFLPDGKYLATVQSDLGADGSNERVKIWNVQSHRQVAFFSDYGPDST